MRGLKYERKVSSKLSEQYPIEWTPGAWICYLCGLEEYPLYCQLDGFLSFGDKIVLVEVKYNHCVDSYFQLLDVYLPLMRHLFPGKSISVCEVVKWYDPSTAFPVSIKLQKDLEKCGENEFSVHILN